MTGTQSRLDRLRDAVLFQVGVELGTNCLFEEFWKQEDVDGLKVIIVVGVGTRFLQCQSNSSRFQQRGDKRRVDHGGSKAEMGGRT